MKDKLGWSSKKQNFVLKELIQVKNVKAQREQGWRESEQTRSVWGKQRMNLKDREKKKTFKIGFLVSSKQQKQKY